MANNCCPVLFWNIWILFISCFQRVDFQIPWLIVGSLIQCSMALSIVTGKSRIASSLSHHIFYHACTTLSIKTNLLTRCFGLFLVLYFGMLQKSHVLPPSYVFNPTKHLFHSRLFIHPWDPEIKIIWIKQYNFVTVACLLPYLSYQTISCVPP